MAGDIIDTTRFPVIDVARGGSIQGEIAALNRLVELAIPSFPLVWQEGGTYVIPGHGRVYEQLDVVEYRDMVTIIRDRVQALIDQGRSLEQVQGGPSGAGLYAPVRVGHRPVDDEQIRRGRLQEPPQEKAKQP